MRFGVRGRSPGQLQRPTGVTVDMNGDIIVADYDNRWISIFSSDGKFKVTSPLQGEKKWLLTFLSGAQPLIPLTITEQDWRWKTDGTQRRGC